MDLPILEAFQYGFGAVMAGRGFGFSLWARRRVKNRSSSVVEKARDTQSEREVTEPNFVLLYTIAHRFC